MDTTFKTPRILKPPLFLITLAALALGLVAFLVWKNHQAWFSPETIKPFLETARNSEWGFAAVVAIYVIGGFVLFPVTVLSLVTAAVFGKLWGPVYAMAGALASGAVVYGIGHCAGTMGVRGLLGRRAQKIDKLFEKAGILGVAAIRFLPVAPYSIVNLAAGISSVSFFDFMLGSFLGFLPMFIIKGFVGDSLLQVLLEPKKETIMYLALGLVLWLALIIASYLLSRRWRRGRTR